MHLFALLIACTGTEPTPTPIVLPSATPPPPWEDSGVYRPPDSDDVSLGNDVPAHEITFEQLGTWERSGAPFDALTGRLGVKERLDGLTFDTSDTSDTAMMTLPCDTGWFVTGTPSGNASCDGCNAAWTLTFTLDPDANTGLANCRDPELPEDGEVWTMALHESDQRVYFDYYGSGIWVPWWTATTSGPSVNLAWYRTLATDVEEEAP